MMLRSWFCMFLFVSIFGAEVTSPTIRLGVIGDSISSGYEGLLWTHPFPRPQNWVTLLAETKRADFGEWMPVSPERPRAGYAHVWAESGFSSGGVLERGWVDAAAKALADGSIDGVIVFVGHDDLQPLLVAKLLGQPVDQAKIDAVVGTFASNYTKILNRLTAVQRGKIMVCTVAEWHRTIYARNLKISKEEFAWLIQTTTLMNDFVRAESLRRGLECIDIAKRFALLLHGMTPQVGNIGLVVDNPGEHPRHFFLPDGMHPGTLVSALLLKTGIEGMNSALNAKIPEFSDQEILTLAGLNSEPVSKGVSP